MSITTLTNADVVLTMNDAQQRLENCNIRLRDGVIDAIGPDIAVEGEGVNVSGCVVTPGLINTHHHLFQTLTRAVPGAQDAMLFGWLQTLYPIWSRMTPDHIHTSTQIGLAELALSGCTMSSDHLYLFPNGSRLDDSIVAAEEIGVRFHPTRGAMSIGESAGGLPPDRLVEREEDILNDTIRVIDAFHDASEGAMCRVGVAPCSPFSVSRELMRDAALLARDKHVRLHTHLAENDEDIAYSLAQFGCRPGQYAEELGWVGDDVWHAHCVKLNSEEIDLFARTKTGVAHCPCSNCRLGSGIAPVVQMRNAGVPVGLGVDGSASNDVGNLMDEARMVMLLQRVASGADQMSAYRALEIATRGGAAVLGRPECGQIAVGKRADLAIWDTRGIDSAGSWDSAALVLAGPRKVKHLFVNGRSIVRDGELVTLDLPRLVERQNAMATALAEAV